MDNLSGDDIATLGYLGALGALLLSGYLVRTQLSLSQVAQQASIWVFIFLAAIAAAGLWSNISDDVTLRQSVETGADGTPLVVSRRQGDGHYYLTLSINETPVEFIVDTGASQIVLNQEDATRIGLQPDTLTYLGRAQTANGEVRTAPVTLETVALGPFVDRNVRAVVNQGDLFDSLLGMSYLETFGRIEISGGVLSLRR